MSGLDAAIRDAFLKEITNQAARIAGVDCSVFAESVRRRLLIGAERYGDTAYRDRDNIHEALEESPDFAAYMLFEHLNDLEDPLETDSKRSYHLFMGAVHAAIADWHARAARHPS